MDLEQANQIDPEYAARFTELSESTGQLIKAHLKQGEPSKDNVFQVLNVLAVHAAAVIAGTGGESFDFFMRCLTGNLRTISEDKGLSLQIPVWGEIAKPDGNG